MQILNTVINFGGGAGCKLDEPRKTKQGDAFLNIRVDA